VVEVRVLLFWGRRGAPPTEASGLGWRGTSGGLAAVALTQPRVIGGRQTEPEGGDSESEMVGGDMWPAAERVACSPSVRPVAA
jgi:hypothetical protein